MEIRDERIDAGKAFDWGRTSADYARYRDIYPDVFYRKIVARGLCVRGQTVLDLGTGTGVLPRNLYRYGANGWGWISRRNRLRRPGGCQPSADRRSPIWSRRRRSCPPGGQRGRGDRLSVLLVFDAPRLTPKLARMLRPDGRLLLLYLAWLPQEDAIAAASEELVLRYSPNWSGAGETVHPITVPGCVLETFEPVFHEEYRVDIPFTRESWHGRMRACRGVGASLSPEELASWESEHLKLLETAAPERFSVSITPQCWSCARGGTARGPLRCGMGIDTSARALSESEGRGSAGRNPLPSPGKEI